MERTNTLRALVTAGLVAGIAGGVLIDAFFFTIQLATGMPPAHLTDNFVIDAATLLGSHAYGNPAAVPIGIAWHLGVSVAWALGYAYLARTQPQLVTRPWVSGAAFGLVVYIFMGILAIYAGQYHRPMPAVLAAQLIAYMVFYGIPVALIVARLFRRSPDAARV